MMEGCSAFKAAVSAPVANVAAAAGQRAPAADTNLREKNIYERFQQWHDVISLYVGTYFRKMLTKAFSLALFSFGMAYN